MGSPEASADAVHPASVRPYALTGGRVPPAGGFPVEALVETLSPAGTALRQTAERRAILRLAAQGYVSIAELSALLRLPLGVVRVVVGDLVEDGLVTVHAVGPRAVRADHGQDPSTSIAVLEGVLRGIVSL